MKFKKMLAMGVLGGGGLQFAYRVTVSAGQATTPLFYFGVGAPAAIVNFGDGTAPEACTSTVEMHHVYAAGGTYTVRLIMPDQAIWVTIIDVDSDLVVRVLTPIHKFGELTQLVAYYNDATWVQDISDWNCPPKLTHTNLTGPNLTGDIGHWVLPASVLHFMISGIGVSGDISGWVIPAGTEHFRINGTHLFGCPVLSSMVAIQSIYAHDLALPQATVDLYLARCVAREAATTYATPALNLGGSNAAPSAQGAADAATLAAAGWTVTVNP